MGVGPLLRCPRLPGCVEDSRQSRSLSAFGVTELSVGRLPQALPGLVGHLAQTLPEAGIFPVRHPLRRLHRNTMPPRHRARRNGKCSGHRVPLLATMT